MLRLIVSSLILSVAAFAQVPAQPSPEKIKKEVDAFQVAVTEAVSSAVPGPGVFQAAKGTYLDGYGIVVTLEVAFEPPRNPFNPGRTPNDVRTSVAQRRKDTMEKLTNLLKQRTPAIESLAPTESATVILYLLNTNPADLPDLPAQIVMSMRKQEAAAGRPNIKEYK